MARTKNPPLALAPCYKCGGADAAVLQNQKGKRHLYLLCSHCGPDQGSGPDKQVALWRMLPEAVRAGMAFMPPNLPTGVDTAGAPAVVPTPVPASEQVPVPVGAPAPVVPAEVPAPEPVHPPTGAPAPAPVPTGAPAPTGTKKGGGSNFAIFASIFGLACAAVAALF